MKTIQESGVRSQELGGEEERRKGVVALNTLETRIEDGRENCRCGWREIGDALKVIRDEKLFAARVDAEGEPFKNFDAYCQAAWGYDRKRASQLIQAAGLSTVVDVDNERQARELLKLLPEFQARLMAALPTPTSSIIKAAVSRINAAADKEAELEQITKEEQEAAAGAKPSPAAPPRLDARQQRYSRKLQAAAKEVDGSFDFAELHERTVAILGGIATGVTPLTERTLSAWQAFVDSIGA
jgi:hypothetical protein